MARSASSRTTGSRSAAKRRPARSAPASAAARSARPRRPTAAQRRKAAARSRRVRNALIWTISLVGVLSLAGIAVMVGSAVRAFDDRLDSLGGAPGPLVAPVDDAPLPYSEEQLGHAATIIAAGRDLGLPLRDQVIAVMTALGESSLRNLDYGDWETSGVTNPDGSRTTSIGLFQQQDGWGTREQRLDPYTAAGLFYRAMIAKVPDRENVEPTLVAHRTQINRDPQHYARYWAAAVRIVGHLTGQWPADAPAP